MPKKHQDRSPKPHKSSDTRANSTLAGTSTNGSTRSRTQDRGGASEARTASDRLTPTLWTTQIFPTYTYCRSTPTSLESRQTLASPSASARGRSNKTLPATKYIDSYLEYRKALFIKIFMAKVEEWFDENVCTLEEANDNDGQTPSGSRSSGNRGMKRPASSGKLNPGSKRHHRDDDPEDQKSDNEEEEDRDRGQKRAKTANDKRKFACPFFKYDQARYKDQRTCCGPGWHEIHRLKEHLYRQHRLFTCSRCLEHFKNQKQLEAHQRATVPCKLREAGSRAKDPGAGMSAETEKQVKSRKSGKQHEDNVSKWYELYHILFPGRIAKEDLPSPWYDTPGSSNGKKGLSADEDLRRQYEHFLRREVPIMIRQQLEACIDEEFGNVSSAVHGRLSSWIQSSAEKCAHIFKYIPTPTEAATQPHPDIERAVMRGTSPVAEPFVNLGETVVAWPFPDPELDLSNISFDLDPNGLSQSLFEQYEPEIDSAYESGSLGGSSSTWRY
ncbi:uncharacterized protein CTRU02_203952 [Colletotrichum truncatum]|uniref:Uncharacterized protein n=1 Tax=Colletotrichum truncatum TaxID=5467 RepID=A0ACC3ZAL5_COLTU